MGFTHLNVYTEGEERTDFMHVYLLLKKNGNKKYFSSVTCYKSNYKTKFNFKQTIKNTRYKASTLNDL